MAHIDLNEPIDWDALDDFDGEARDLAGDFFFEVDSDEDEDRDDEHMIDLRSADGGNRRGGRTLGLTGLRSAQRWNAEGARSGPLYVGESSSAGARRGSQFAGNDDGNGGGDDNGAGCGAQFAGNGDGYGAGDGNGVGDGNTGDSSGNEGELVPFPLFDGVVMFTSPAIAARGRGAARRGAAARGARGRGGGRGPAAGRGDGDAAGRVRGRGTAARRGRGREGTAGGRGRGREGVGGGHGRGDGDAADDQEDDAHEQGAGDGEVVPLGRMVNVRRVYSDEDKRIIIAALLRKTKPDVLSYGVTKEVVAQFMVPLRVVQRVWFDHLEGIENVCNKKPL